MINITEFPPEILELIFDNLNEPRDLLNSTETCKRFKEVIETSEKLIKKITLYVNFPATSISFKNVVKKSKRRYRNLCITRSRTKGLETNHINLSHVFENIGPVIKCLTINWCRIRNFDIPIGNNLEVGRRRLRPDMPFNQNIAILRAQQGIIRDDIREELNREFTSVLKHFVNLEKTVWNNVNMERRGNSNESITFDFSSLRELEMKQCDAYCFDLLSSCRKLKSIKISDPFWSNNRSPGIDNFETFLIAQKHLKVLNINSIQYPRLFQTDRSRSIQFQLSHLTLKNVFFKDKIIAEDFFKTQTQLVAIDLQLQNEKVKNLDELNWYNNIIKIVLSQNPLLKFISIEKIKYKIGNLNFLNYTKYPNISELNFSSVAEDRNAELFKAFVQKMPNLRSIMFKSDSTEDTDGDVCFNKGTVLENLQSLVIINASVKSLINVYAENLQVFEYSPKLNGKFIDDYIGGFLHQHRNLRELRIGCKSGTSYFFVSYNLCELIVNFLQQLESITIYNFAEVNKSVKALCNLRHLHSLTLSDLQYQQFTAKTKVECERMKLKLIPVEIKHPYETREYSDS